jgi:hyperosmotically inducible periplasmic protein
MLRLVLMRGFSMLCVMALTAALALARDPSTRPAPGDPAAGGERSPATNPARAEDRFESETRSKSDEMLADAVHQKLSDDTRTNATRIKVDARAGVIRLTGDVTSREERDTAAHVAQQVPGVRAVDNRLHVTQAGVPAPGTSPIPERVTP